MMLDTSFFQEYDDIIKSSDSIPKIREMILQLAVQGRLVEQDPDDEPANVLLEKIKAEKEKLVKEGKIKKSKPLPEIKPEEVPYELPEGWEWVRLGEITSRIGSGSTPRGGKSVYTDEGPIFLRSQNVWNEGLKLDDVAHIPKEIHKKMSNTHVLGNDILLNITGASLGRCTLVPENIGEVNVSQHVSIIRQIDTETRKYLHKCFLSPFIQKLIWGRQVGVAREGLSKKVFELFEIPLPPLQEQHRIVTRIEALMAICDQLEAQQKAEREKNLELNNSALHHLLESKSREEFNGHWNMIQVNFDNLYDKIENVNKLQEAVLQLAVQGRLVEQDPDDEPASVLLEKIKAEKEKLIKEGKIRKSKPLPEIKPEEVPYELPEGWEWVRIREIAHNLGQKKPDVEFSYVDVSAINKEKGLITEHEVNVIQPNDAPSRARKMVTRDTVIYSTVRPYLLNIAIINKDFSPEPIVSTAFAVLHPFAGINNKYIYYYLRSQTFIDFVEKQMIGVAYPAISEGNFNQGLVPLPPESEQKRIVARVEELMALTNQLKEQIEVAGNLRKELVGASVGEVLNVEE